MATKIYKSACLILSLFIFTNPAFSEGTKQFRPASTDNGNLEIYDQGRPFALESNTNPFNRLYIHIASTTEKIYMGFQHVGTGSGTFRIKNAAGTVVYARTTVPSSGAGYINTYAEAVAGPKIAGTPAGGYSPLSYTPTTTGDFYIEFTTSLTSTYHFDLFDITVMSAIGTAINGRLWSYAWDLSTRGNTNAYNGAFYVYTDEGYVSQVNLNGMQPYGFVISCNNTGTGNSGDVVEDRKSVAGNSTRPQFKVFLNNPDVSQYPSPTAATLSGPITVEGGQFYYGEPAKFDVSVTAPGTTQVILDMNGVAGFQDGTSDVLIAKNVTTGANVIDWDGKNGFGVFPPSGTVINVTNGFSAGITHLPIYDPETNPNGYLVTRVRPGSGSAPVRWDDTNLSGSYNVTGASGNKHVWGTNFGDTKTMNTWWNGFEVENISSFTLTVKLKPLPVELISFDCEKTVNNNVKLSWVTATESNNDHFTIEKTNDGMQYATIATIKGYGNSLTTKNYSFTDEHTNTGTSFYRLKQTDYNGKFVYTGIKAIHIEAEAVTQKFSVFPNPSNGSDLNISLGNDKNKTATIIIYSITGEEVYKTQADISGANTSVLFNNKIPAGTYILSVQSGQDVNSTKIIIE